MPLTVLEICAGAGGQAIGLEEAGFLLAGAVEIDRDACRTLRSNRPSWPVFECDIREIDGRKFRGIQLLAGGVPCPPFSIAGKQLGRRDERDLFPEALRLIEEAKPIAILLENVPGFASVKFSDYRRRLLTKLSTLGYIADWRILNACSFGVPQLRPRCVLVGMHERYWEGFYWPREDGKPPSVGDAVGDLMASGRWRGASQWRRKAKGIAPTIVGGSKKHGGPDLGPTRARRQWAKLGVDGLGIADEPPGPDFPVDKKPRLTVRMVARVQGFPDDWIITGAKTAAYRQVGNALPPPVASAVGEAIAAALTSRVSRLHPRQAALFQPQTTW